MYGRIYTYMREYIRVYGARVRMYLSIYEEAMFLNTYIRVGRRTWASPSTLVAVTMMMLAARASGAT